MTLDTLPAHTHPPFNPTCRDYQVAAMRCGCCSSMVASLRCCCCTCCSGCISTWHRCCHWRRGWAFSLRRRDPRHFQLSARGGWQRRRSLAQPQRRPTELRMAAGDKDELCKAAAECTYCVFPESPSVMSDVFASSQSVHGAVISKTACMCKRQMMQCTTAHALPDRESHQHNEFY